MARHSLVVVSNRLPFSLVRDSTGRPNSVRSPGGLVSALSPALKSRGGVWIGWSGTASEESRSATKEATAGLGFDVAEVPLSSREISGYYSGFSNRTVWPLLHYFVGRMEIDSNWWSVYNAVNQRFAQAAAAAAGQKALVWIHDYQLLRVPHYLRAAAPHLASALFLHVPFPAADVFRILPWSRELLHGMLSADYVGFQVEVFARHFLRSAEMLLGCDVDTARGIVRYDGRDVSVGAHSISIDVGEAETLAGAAAPGPRQQPAPAEILAVDRLDYTKGVVRRLAAIERVLETQPPRRLRFTQVLVPSREKVPDYSNLKQQIDEAVGRVNGRFSVGGWSPVRYIARPVPREELFAMYRQADVALVTPLRDGMNLVAKEYVASQLDDDGVLILSELAGAAEELQEALIVNPFHGDAVVEAIQRALSMPEQERHARMSALRARVRARDVHAWVSNFMDAAERAAEYSRGQSPNPLDEVTSKLGPWLSGRSRVALLLDYDGTITPIVDRPEAAQLSQTSRLAIEAAARSPGIDVFIVSGRALDDVRDRVGLPNVTYAGNHGFEIDGPGLQFRHEAAGRIDATMQSAGVALEQLQIPGSQVEIKGPTLAFHYRGVAEKDQDEARRHARALLRRRRLRVVEGKFVLEGRPQVDWHKGHAVLWLLGQRYGDDWPSHVRAVFIGDDTTDEDVFRSLEGIGRSVCVGSLADTDASHADYRLPDSDAVIALVRWLTSGAFRPPAG